MKHMLKTIGTVALSVTYFLLGLLALLHATLTEGR